MTTVTDYFRDYAPRYDEFAMRAMPRYEEMLLEVVRCLPDGIESILELGCGTGSLTTLLARHYPDGTITANDGSPEMIERARQRLGSSAVPNNRVRFVASLFEDLDIGEAAYDLITSNMSLHHIADKLSFYRRLNTGLKRGGLFVFGDELAGISALVEEANRNGWLEYARRTGNLTADEIADVLKHESEFDHYETLPRQLELLSEAGFQSPDCVWRYLNYAVFVAEA
jgi:tRNA (cmo5U34)-methyltransferase